MSKGGRHSDTIAGVHMCEQWFENITLNQWCSHRGQGGMSAPLTAKKSGKRGKKLGEKGRKSRK